MKTLSILPITDHVIQKLSLKHLHCTIAH